MLIDQGIEMMQLGMGIVFFFLIVLLNVIKLMSFCVNLVAPPVQNNKNNRNNPNNKASAVDGKTLQIIQKAIKQHYNNK